MFQRCVALMMLLAGFVAGLDFQVPAADPKAKLDPKLAALAAKLKSPSDSERTKALDAISNLGKEGAPLARPLCDLIADPGAAKVAALAGTALSKVRPDLGPAVIKLRLMKEKDSNREVEAAQEIGALGKEGAPAVPVLIAVIKETAASKNLDGPAKQAALTKEVEALAAIAENDPAVFNTLVTFAGSGTRDASLRAAALVSLATMAAANEDLHKRVLPLVKTALDAEPVRLAAIEAATRLGTIAKDLRPALTKLADDADEKISKPAKDALDAVQGKGKVAATAAPLSPEVKAALAVLVKNQQANGNFLKAEYRYLSVVATSFGALSLMASGGEYEKQIDLAVDYVIKEIFLTYKDYGLEAPRDRSNWCIGIGGLFLCEYYAAKKKKDPNFESDKLRAALERVVEEACNRIEDTGGWGHTMRVKIDGGYRELEVMSNWMLATLGACQRLGFKVPADKVKKAMQFVQDCCPAGRGDVGYSPQLKTGCPARTGGALFAYAMLGQQKNTLYPLMVSSFRSSLAKTSEAHGSQAMGYLWSAVAARQIGTQEWRAYKAAFFPKIQAKANDDGTFKVLTGTTPHSASLDHQWDPTYNLAILALILQLDRANLVFMGQKH